MKEFITPKYNFQPGTSGVGYVDLFGITDFDINRLVAIINQTDGVIIYSTGSSANKFTQVSGTKVYLNVDTSTMSSDDEIQVIYNLDASTMEVVQTLKQIFQAIAKPPTRDLATNTERATIISLPSVTISSGSVNAAVTGSIQDIGRTGVGNAPIIQAQLLPLGTNIMAWYASCRSRIS